VIQGHDSEAALIQAVKQRQVPWDALLAQIQTDRITEPGFAEKWTFKDNIARLTAWRKRSPARWRAPHRDDPPARLEWPGSEDTEEVNWWNQWRIPPPLRAKWVTGPCLACF